MLSATPARQRSMLSQSRPPSTARSQGTTRTVEAPEMPEYEPPEAPLTAETQRQLASLLNSPHLRHLKTHLRHATEKLTDTAGDVNERLIDARVRLEKTRQQRRDVGEDVPEDQEDQDSEEVQQLAERERKVEDVTARMEEKMRQVIDSETRLQRLLEAMTNIEREEGEAQAAALGSRQTRRQRRRQRRDSQDGEEDGDDERDETYEGSPEREARERNAQNPPSRRLDGSLEEGTGKWSELSLTERYVDIVHGRNYYIVRVLTGQCRYAGNNSYIGFYRIVHDSKFPGDEVPPLPHSSTWFSHLEDTSAQASASTASSPGQRGRSTRNQREPSPADSDEIAIERERISLKCPLTLLPFRDPVTSTKCPHSFEREAINDMIARSNFHIPPPSGRGGRRIRAVKCPVCSIPLTTDDFRPDPVLLRKVRRAEELLERETEDQLDGSQRQGDRPDRVMLASDAVDADDIMDVDVDDDSDQPRVKLGPVASESGSGSGSGRGRGSESESESEEEDMGSE